MATTVSIVVDNETVGIDGTKGLVVKDGVFIKETDKSIDTTMGGESPSNTKLPVESAVNQFVKDSIDGIETNGDHRVLVSSDDTNPSYLQYKIKAGTDIELEVESDGESSQDILINSTVDISGKEDLSNKSNDTEMGGAFPSADTYPNQIAAQGYVAAQIAAIPAPDHKVITATDDLVPETLDDKIILGSGLVKTIVDMVSFICTAGNGANGIGLKVTAPAGLINAINQTAGGAADEIEWDGSTLLLNSGDTGLISALLGGIDPNVAPAGITIVKAPGYNDTDSTVGSALDNYSPVDLDGYMLSKKLKIDSVENDSGPDTYGCKTGTKNYQVTLPAGDVVLFTKNIIGEGTIRVASSENNYVLKARFSVNCKLGSSNAFITIEDIYDGASFNSDTSFTFTYDNDGIFTFISTASEEVSVSLSLSYMEYPYAE